MIIGPRVWKTGLAVTVTLWISELLHFEYSYLAAIAAIISLQPTITDSLYKGWERIQATAIGVIISLVIMYALGSTPLLIGFTIIITILVCLKFGWTESIVLASVTVAIIMAGGREDTVGYALERSVIQPFLGIAVAVVINLVFSPPQHINLVKQSLRDLNEDIEMLMMRVTNSFLTCDNYSTDHVSQLVEKLHQSYEQAKQNLHMYKNERGHFKYLGAKKADDILEYEQVLELLWLIGQRVIDIQQVSQERCKRISKIENPSTEYNDLLNSVQDFLFLTTSLEKNIIENFLDHDQNRQEIIRQQVDEITSLREDLRKRINQWQEKHLGPDHIRSLIEIATLVYDLDQICNLLFQLKDIKDESSNEENLSANKQ